MADSVIEIITYIAFIVGGLIIAYLLSVFINKVIVKLTKGVPQEERKRIQSGITIAVMLLAVTLILSVLNVEVSILLLMIGLFGFATIIGSRTYLENYVSGKLFLLSQADPITIGSYLEVEGISGYIIRMGSISVILRTTEGLLISLPYYYLLRKMAKVYPANSEFSLEVPIQVYDSKKLEKIENMIRNSFINATLRLDTTERGEMIVIVSVPLRDPRKISDTKTDILKMVNIVANE